MIVTPAMTLLLLLEAGVVSLAGLSARLHVVSRRQATAQTLPAPRVVPLLEAPTPAPVQCVEIVIPRDAEEPKFDAAAGDKWVAEAREAAIAIASVKGEVTSDDVWSQCPPPDGVDGRLLSKALNRREWEVVGYRHSERGRNAARQIAVWRLKAVA